MDESLIAGVSDDGRAFVLMPGSVALRVDGVWTKAESFTVEEMYKDFFIVGPDESTALLTEAKSALLIMTIPDSQKWALAFLRHEESKPPYTDEEGRLIETGYNFADSKLDGNELRKSRTDMEQMRIALLAAQKMKAESCSKAKALDFLLDQQVRYVQQEKNRQEIGRNQIKKYLEGHPRGRTPEHYLALDQSENIFFDLQGSIDDWEEWFGLKFAQTAPSKTLTYDYDEDQRLADESFLSWAKPNAPPKGNKP